jgi:PAS domain-containing protein
MSSSENVPTDSTVTALTEARDRHKAEAALAASEEQFRMLVSGVKDYAIFLLDPKGYVVTWNGGPRE